MATPPTRVGRYEPTTGNFSSTTTPKTTTQFDMNIGDRFWAQAQVENASSQTVVTPSVSAGAVDWTLQARVPDASTDTVSALWGWTGVCTSAATNVTSQLARPSSSGILWWGFSVTRITGSDGVGVIWDANNGTGSGAPSAPQTVQDNSLVIFNVNDWNAADGSSRAFQMGAIESNYFRDAARHTVYGAYVADTVAGIFTAGLTAPAAQRWGLIGVEFLGAAVEVPGVPALQENNAGILLEDNSLLLF